MIDWLIAERDTLPPAGHILSPPELERYGQLRSEKRRDDWLLGRWAAKQLLRRHMARRGSDLSLQAIMIFERCRWGAAGCALGHGPGPPAGRRRA